MPKARKDQELKWLRLAQQKCAAFPRSSPDDDDEKPDFLFPEVNLGIEVTEYIQGQGVRGSPIRRRESIQENLTKEAQKRFEAASKERLQVSVFWCAETTPEKVEFEYLIQSIVQIVTTLLAQGRECWRPDLGHVDEIKLGKHLGQIWIYRLKQSQSYWSCDEAGAIGDDVNRVQALISKKDGRVISNIGRNAASCGC